VGLQPHLYSFILFLYIYTTSAFVVFYIVLSVYVLCHVEPYVSEERLHVLGQKQLIGCLSAAPR